MARPPLHPNDVKNIPVVTMCSKNDLARHDGKTALQEKFREKRDELLTTPKGDLKE